LLRLHPLIKLLLLPTLLQFFGFGHRLHSQRISTTVRCD
jgi:hypothetical protein